MAAPAQVTVRRPDRLFYVGMAVAAAVIVFAGFSRTYFLKAHFGTPFLPPLLHLHGLLFTSWIACVLNDSVTHRRLHPAYVWGGLFLILSHPVRLAVAGTGAWLSFARWLTG